MTKAPSRGSVRGFRHRDGGLVFSVASWLLAYSAVTSVMAARAADSSTIVLFAA